ncbi:hypothetical protein ACFSCW_04950 [Sphingomonas tabacisoli]|uniref:Uncharacterized protein n=1 Tax=Sphingomonas tabacisoli TaxID=2249466 RepID=A0ABW4I131_9SPHN
MAEATASSVEDRALDALTKILETSISPEMQEAQQIILRRLALAGSLFPSRVPPPLNITEVGGYLNLLQDLPELRLQVLSSTLGVAGPNVAAGFGQPHTAITFVTRRNDRPAGPAQAATPVSYTIRSDFAPALDEALAAIRNLGGTLPLLSPARALPTAGPGVQPPDDLLAVTGRVLEIVPATALADPANDPIALGASGAGAPQVLARQVNSAAPGAGTIASASWNLWACTDTGCSQQAVTGLYIPVAPHLEAAGWHQDPLPAPTSLTDQGGWQRWTNISGLVAGRSRLGDELLLLYPSEDIARSSLATILDYRWNGATFAGSV